MSFADWESAHNPKKPYPWKPIADYSPDRQPSSSEIYSLPSGKDMILAAAVKGVGVLVFRTTSSLDDTPGKLVVTGISCYPKAELGYCPDL